MFKTIKHFVVPAWQDTSYSCVAACLQMLVSSHGIHLDHRTAMRQVRTTKNAGAEFRHVKQVLKKQYNVRTTMLYPNVHTFRKYLKDHVLLVDNETEYVEPHAMVISGVRFYEGQYQFRVLDPLRLPKWRIGSEITAGATEALACSLP